MNDTHSTSAPNIGLLQKLVGYHLRRASNVITSDFFQALAGTGMRPVPFAVLSVIEANPGVSQGVVGRMLGIQRANMVALINELLERKLILRETSKDDRRAFKLSLTDKGHDLFAECSDAILAHEEAILSNLTERQRLSLISLLAKITEREEDLD